MPEQIAGTRACHLISSLPTINDWLEALCDSAQPLYRRVFITIGTSVLRPRRLGSILQRPMRCAVAVRVITLWNQLSVSIAPSQSVIQISATADWRGSNLCRQLCNLLYHALVSDRSAAGLSFPWRVGLRPWLLPSQIRVDFWIVICRATTYSWGSNKAEKVAYVCYL